MEKAKIETVVSSYVPPLTRQDVDDIVEKFVKLETEKAVEKEIE